MSNKDILFFIFFSPTSLKNPCRDPSTVEYSECALASLQICHESVGTCSIGIGQISGQMAFTLSRMQFNLCELQLVQLVWPIDNW